MYPYQTFYGTSEHPSNRVLELRRVGVTVTCVHMSHELTLHGLKR
jgi:hypothetical protein